MLRMIAALAMAGALSGCVVVDEPAVVAGPPAGVAYVAPVRPVPAPGYVWRYHPRHGWGWWHPHYGWYAGWR